MSRDFPESDWKIFRKLHAIALERFFDQAVAELKYHLGEEGKTSKELFWDAFERLDKRRKEAARLFDGLRRSTAFNQLAFIYSSKLLTEAEMSQLSPKTLDDVHVLCEFIKGRRQE